MGRKTIVTVVGTRPQFIKAAALNFVPDEVKEVLVHTGQHYDLGLSEQIWEGLGLKKPDHVLQFSSHEPYRRMELFIKQLGDILLREMPDYVIVIGDCDSTLAGALTADLLKIPVIHIEAGLRSFDRSMPEERNRKLVDHLATVNFCIYPANKFQLVMERCSPHLHVVGDTLYDTFIKFVDKVKPIPGDYILATVHREENVEKYQYDILNELDELGVRILFPNHPRIKTNRPYKNIEFLGPVDYVSMLALELNAKMIVTDSGGVGREAVWLGKPCVMLRGNTEFPYFVKTGHVVLAGPTGISIAAAIETEWPDEPADHGQDGQAAKRIAEIIYAL